MFKDEDKNAQYFRYAERQQDLVTLEQRETLDTIIARLESLPSLTVTQVTPVWYIVEGHGKKIQLEVDNPGGNLDIVEITDEDDPEELKFPRKSWGTEMTKLYASNTDFAERKIVAMFAKRRGE